MTMDQCEFIPNGAFMQCTNLKTVSFRSCKVIGQQAFDHVTLSSANFAAVTTSTVANFWGDGLATAAHFGLTCQTRMIRRFLTLIAAKNTNAVFLAEKGVSKYDTFVYWTPTGGEGRPPKDALKFSEHDAKTISAEEVPEGRYKIKIRSRP